MKKGVSVIICCYNSAARLPQTIGHIVRQKNIDFNWEVIIVDNASSDTTAAVASSLLSASLPAEKFKIVNETTPGLIYARKKGMSVTQYEYLLFCDDDNWLAENYLKQAYDIMEQNPRIGMLGGKGEAVFENIHPSWFSTYQINFAVGDQAPMANTTMVKMQMVYGAGCMARSEVMQKLEKLNFSSLLSGRKGNSLISGDDNELCAIIRYLGYDVYYNKELTFKHLMTDGRMQWSYLKKLYHGFGRMRLYTQAYTYLEHHSSPPGKGLKYALWKDKYFHRLKEMKEFIPGVWFKMNEEGNDKVLWYMALRGELFELWNLKEKYDDVFTKITDLKSNIERTK